MALIIKESNQIIEVWGNLNSQNINSLSRHLELSRRRKEFLVLSLDHIDHIDESSTKILEQQYCNTAASNKVLSIIGRENESVKQVMRQTKTTYILSNDRI
ncbi:MAG: ATP-binding protein [Muriicola sp.]|nr:ATP-binding protein [Muriicola sp.]